MAAIFCFFIRREQGLIFMIVRGVWGIGSEVGGQSGVGLPLGGGGECSFQAEEFL